jgi:2-keto-4-pentenoate hydratase
MALSAEAIEQGARLLIEARRSAQTLEALPDACRPGSVADGYAMQAAFRRLYGKPVAGWKVGATAGPVQAMFGIDHPFLGPIFEGEVHASPARVPAEGFQHLMIESEFVIRFGKALPVRAQRYARAEILAAAEAVIPAFELISPRFAGLPTQSVASAIADCGVNAGEVLGRPVPVADWAALGLPRQPVTLAVNGRVVAEGTGALVLGDPLNVLEWLAGELARQGIGISAGQLVSTGTCTGLVTLKAGETAVASFGDLGSVEVRFT